MRTTITRSLTQTTIHPVKVSFENGVPTTEALEPIVAFGNLTNEQATKVVAKEFGKNSNVVVAKTEVAEKMYEISVSDFVKYAKVVEPKNETNTNSEAV